MTKAGMLAASAAVLLAACATPGGSGEGEGAGEGAEWSSPLAGTTWRLAELQPGGDGAEAVRPADTSRYTMELAADGTAAFQLDCNRAFGRWESAGPGELEFSPLGMTRVACPAGSLDTRIAGELDEVQGYDLVGDRLTLHRAGGAGSILWVRPSVQPVPEPR